MVRLAGLEPAGYGIETFVESTYLMEGLARLELTLIQLRCYDLEGRSDTAPQEIK